MKRMLEALDDMRLEAGSKLLVLTDAHGAAALRAHAVEATILTDVSELDGVKGDFDAALLYGLLENRLWDRWVLQRVHRALRMSAPIVVVVPPLASLVSAIDVRFWAYASTQIARRFVQRWKPGFELLGPVRRRYHLPRLVRKMESVGYTAIEPGTGWRDDGAAWFARWAILKARKGSSMPGVNGRTWPDPDFHRRRYMDDYAAIPAAREAWLSAFPEFHRLTARSLDPADWRDARVLVVSPHPDDELIGCGGTLCRLLAAGAEVSVLQATDGSMLPSLRDLPRAVRKVVRLAEAKQVAAALGARLFTWGAEDTALRCADDTVAEMARLLEALRPTHVFTPFLGDPHDDHRTVSRILGGALGQVGFEPSVLQYEVWSLVPANLYCDVTEQAARLEQLLLLYERAMRADDLVHFCHSRNLVRGLELTGGHAYVEAFLCTSSADYRQLTEACPAMEGRARWISSFRPALREAR